MIFLDMKYVFLCLLLTGRCIKESRLLHVLVTLVDILQLCALDLPQLTYVRSCVTMGLVKLVLLIQKEGLWK
jgi:hypothetical protein